MITYLKNSMTTTDRIFLGTLMASYIRVLNTDMARGAINRSQYHARLNKARETEQKIITNRI